MRKFFILFFAIFVLVTFSIPQKAFLAIPNGFDPLVLSIDPSLPEPEQLVLFKLDSYSMDISRANIVWTVDKKIEKEGIGETRFQTTAPFEAKTKTVVVTVTPTSGAKASKTYYLRSGALSIAWEADSYVPPLYMGKSLLPYQGSIKFVAIPTLFDKKGVQYKNENMVYRWEEDGEYKQDSSGYGKQSYKTKIGPLDKPVEITVTAESKDNYAKAIASISMNSVGPEILFYEEDPLYGVLWNKALPNNTPMKYNEMRIVASPYNFSLPAYNNNALSFEWNINNIDAPEMKGEKSLVLRTNGDKNSLSALNLTIKNTENILQQARGYIQVYFSKKQ